MTTRPAGRSSSGRSREKGASAGPALTALVRTALSVAAIAVGLGACSRERAIAAAPPSLEPPRPGYAVPRDGYLALAFDDSGGLRALASNDAPPPRTAAPFPMAISAAAIQSLRKGAVLAVNRQGPLWLEGRRYEATGPEARGEARLVIEGIQGARDAFAARTVASAWASGGKALFLLCRHPVYETADLSGPASIVMAADEYSAALFSPSLGDDAFAVYPTAPDSWLVQYRSETEDRVRTDYAIARPRPEAEGGLTRDPIGRSHFERLASPLPVAAAPVELGAALEALVGPLLVEATMSDGSRRAFLRGDAGEAAPAWAHVTDDAAAHGGVSAVVVTDDWRLAIQARREGAPAARLVNLDAPLPGATARGVAMVGSLVVVLWEQGSFPDVTASGIYALDPAL